MKYKILIAAIFLSTLFSCQDTNKGDTASAPIEPKVGSYSQTTTIPEGILTPDVVETSIGTLNFFDGTPTTETVQLVYDNLDRSRGIDAFLKGLKVLL